MKTVCENNKCSGCMACLEICPKHAITVLENISAYNAVIDETKCIHCNLCHIGFRTKTKFQIDSSAKHLSTLGTRDCYTIAFLNSLSYTENCYECRYASIERVSDVTLGDSWGSEMAEEVQRKGISLILCQTEKGKELIANSELELHEVELNKAIENNHQLQGPSKMPEKRTYFLESLQDGKPFNKTVMKCYPKQCIKQMVKGILIKLRIVGGVK